MSLFRKIFGATNDTSNEENQSQYNELSLDNSATVEERFTSIFMKNGGKFIYCESLNEIKEQFLNILEENDWFECEVMCHEQKLFNMLDDNKLSYDKPKEPKFLFATCESLIAEEGSVLFSSNQIKQHKPNELPKNIVIFATVNQIMDSKSDGLRAIKKKYLTAYPTNITTIKYFEEEKEEDFLHYGSSAKNLYLLLLEEQ
jgi:L-lactate utilization protein LutC